MIVMKLDVALLYDGLEIAPCPAGTTPYLPSYSSQVHLSSLRQRASQIPVDRSLFRKTISHFVELPWHPPKSDLPIVSLPSIIGSEK